MSYSTTEKEVTEEGGDTVDLFNEPPNELWATVRPSRPVAPFISVISHYFITGLITGITTTSG